MNKPYKEHLEQQKETFLGYLLNADEHKKKNLNQGEHEGRWYFGKRLDFGEGVEVDCVIFDDGNFAFNLENAPKELPGSGYNYIKNNFEIDYDKGLLRLDTAWSKNGYEPFILSRGSVGSVGSVASPQAVFVKPIFQSKKGLKGSNLKLNPKNGANSFVYPEYTLTTLTTLNKTTLNNTESTLTYTKNCKIKEIEWTTGKALFDTLTKIQSHYMDVHDNRIFKLTTAFILGTYCFELFSAYGYLFFNSDKETGKTKFAEIIGNLSFNLQDMTSPSESVLFRVCELTKGVQLVDDFEKIPDERRAPLEQILKVGYKKGGKAARTEKRKDEFVPVFFDVYSPKLITNTTTLNHILLTRCVPIHLMRTPTDKGRLWPKFSDPVWQFLRDCCYNFVMDNWQAIKKASEEIQIPKLNNRNLELVKPCLAVAKVCSEDYFKELKKYVVECFEERNIIDISTSWEYALLKCIYEETFEEGDYYPASKITEWVKDYFYNLGVERKEALEHPSVYWIGKQLSKFPLFKKRRVGAGVEYLISKGKAEKTMISLGYPLSDKKEEEKKQDEEEEIEVEKVEVKT